MSEYIVYTDRPHTGGCSVRTIKIPHGQTYREIRDFLPPSVGKLSVVRAYSASTAREFARDYRQVRCNGGTFGGSRRGRRR